MTEQNGIYRIGNGAHRVGIKARIDWNKQEVIALESGVFSIPNVPWVNQVIPGTVLDALGALSFGFHGQDPRTDGGASFIFAGAPTSQCSLTRAAI